MRTFPAGVVGIRLDDAQDLGAVVLRQTPCLRMRDEVVQSRGRVAGHHHRADALSQPLVGIADDGHGVDVRMVCERILDGRR